MLLFFRVHFSPLMSYFLCLYVTQPYSRMWYTVAETLPKDDLSWLEFLGNFVKNQFMRAREIVVESLLANSGPWVQSPTPKSKQGKSHPFPAEFNLDAGFSAIVCYSALGFFFFVGCFFKCSNQLK